MLCKERGESVNGPEWTSLISMSVLPVVIISACGLLSLAFYGRLAAVVSRLRVFQREMRVEQEKLESTGAVAEARLLEVLQTQTHQVTRRARLIRLALLFFLTTVGLLIICSLALALSWFVRASAFLAAVFFVLGLCSMLGGIIAAMMELRGALEPVELEMRFVSNTVEPSIAEALQEAGALAADERGEDTAAHEVRS
jgi:ABC-type multidrug transport system fused ATPase/permease subunit